MSLVSLDTPAIAQKLQAAGFSDVQADAVAGVIRDTRSEILRWVLSAIGFQTIVVVGAIVARIKGLH